jgi:uncharacterized protein YecT (DUF1311 family)
MLLEERDLMQYTKPDPSVLNKALNKSVPFLVLFDCRSHQLELEYEMRRAVWRLMVLLFAPVAVSAASFDCDKARTEIEKMICADADLSKLDDVMARAYISAKVKAGDELRAQQRQWLKDRDLNCVMDTVCLGDSYRERIQQLTLIASGVYLQGLETGLVLGRGIKVCEEYEKIVRDMESSLMCARKIPAKHESLGFTQPVWREIDPIDYMELVVAMNDRMTLAWNSANPKYHQTPGQRVEASGDSLTLNYRNNHYKWYLSEADVDNDGVPETLVKFRKGRCNDAWPDVDHYAIPIMVRDVSGKSIDMSKSRQLLRRGASSTLAVTTNSFDVFSFDGKTYVDRWENEGGRNGQRTTEKTLTIFLHVGSASNLMCQFKYRDGEVGEEE